MWTSLNPKGIKNLDELSNLLRYCFKKAWTDKVLTYFVISTAVDSWFVANKRAQALESFSKLLEYGWRCTAGSGSPFERYSTESEGTTVQKIIQKLDEPVKSIKLWSHQHHKFFCPSFYDTKHGKYFIYNQFDM